MRNNKEQKNSRGNAENIPEEDTSEEITEDCKVIECETDEEEAVGNPSVTTHEVLNLD